MADSLLYRGWWLLVADPSCAAPVTGYCNFGSVSDSNMIIIYYLLVILVLPLPYLTILAWPLIYRRSSNMTEYKDYDALVQNINIGDITSSEHNANILRTLRDGNPCWNKTLYILEDEIDGDIDEFIIRTGDDLGWLGYFIGRSEVIEALEVQYLSEEGEQVDAFMRGVACNQSIKELTIQTDLGDQGFGSLECFLQNKNALTRLIFEGFHKRRSNWLHSCGGSFKTNRLRS